MISLVNFVILLLTFFTCLYNADSANYLDAVVVIFRHGDRTPIQPYPNDPYKNRSFWPVDWGMLTNLGKVRQYNLGKYFRQRYADFLPEIYSEKDIHIQSTDVDRTIMSAQSNLAGFYPPVGADIWKNGFSWQPIPIHTLPENIDVILAARKPCTNYDYFLKELLETEYFRNISATNHDLYTYLTKYSGNVVNSVKKINYLYNTLQIEQWNNFTLPEWTKNVFPDKLAQWAALSFAIPTYNKELARLKTGPFFYELIKYFNNRSETAKNSEYYSPKFLMYSAHDITIANLLNSMEVFEYHCPPYTATIIFEFYKNTDNNSSYINILYKNSTEAKPIKLKNCNFNCDLQDFKEILKPIAVDSKNWESECNRIIWSQYLNIFYFLLIGLLILILATLFRSCNIDENRSSSHYLSILEEAT